MSNSKARRRDGMTMPFHLISATVLAAGTFAQQASPSGLGNRVLAEADGWAHFRFRELRFRLHPAPGITTNQAMGFVGGSQDSPPTTVLQIGELIPSTVVSGRATGPSEWVSVAKSDFAGPLPWYKSINGAADVTEETPGNFVLAGTATDAILFEIRGVIEFKTSVSTGNTPLARQAAALLRQEKVAIALRKERESIVKVLSITDGQPGASTLCPTVILPK